MEQVRDYPAIKCISDKQAFMVCVEHKCKDNPFICYNQKCECKLNAHKLHNTNQISDFIDKINQRKQTITKQTQQTYNAIKGIYQQMIQELNNDLKQLEILMEQNQLDEYQRKFSYYLKSRDSVHIDGEFMNKLKQQIKIPRFNKDNAVNLQQVNQFWKRKQKYFNQFCEDIKSLVKNKIKKFDSKIIKEYQLINQFLGNNLKRIKLLYRGSENNFNVKKFHQLCDNKPNTLTIVETEFGKVIGGYTPLCWKLDQWKYYGDESKKSFLFSITNRQKYPIISNNGEKAIQCSFSCYGPTFGGGNDLQIRDNADKNNQNYANFPTSYNNGKYTNNQQSYKSFSGASQGRTFKIKEWQVFEVEFHQFQDLI